MAPPPRAAPRAGADGSDNAAGQLGGTTPCVRSSWRASRRTSCTARGPRSSVRALLAHTQTARRERARAAAHVSRAGRHRAISLRPRVLRRPPSPSNWQCARRAAPRATPERRCAADSGLLSLCRLLFGHTDRPSGARAPGLRGRRARLHVVGGHYRTPPARGGVLWCAALGAGAPRRRHSAACTRAPTRRGLWSAPRADFRPSARPYTHTRGAHVLRCLPARHNPLPGPAGAAALRRVLGPG